LSSINSFCCSSVDVPSTLATNNCIGSCIHLRRYAILPVEQHTVSGFPKTATKGKYSLRFILLATRTKVCLNTSILVELERIIFMCL
jgi:hypothetical protein